jgi:hypothetical protein
MIFFNKENKYYYIPILKNYSTYIKIILMKNKLEYISKENIPEYSIEKINAITFFKNMFFYINWIDMFIIVNYYKLILNTIYNNLNENKIFVFIRNPYKRFISGYLWVCKSKFIKNKNNNINNLNDLLLNKNKIDILLFSHIFIRQSHFFNYDKYLISKVKIYKDIDSMIDAMNVNLNNKNDINKNNSNYEKPFYEYYDQEILDEVNKLFADDFVNFDYQTFSNIDDFKNFFKT